MRPEGRFWAYRERPQVPRPGPSRGHTTHWWREEAQMKRRCDDRKGKNKPRGGWKEDVLERWAGGRRKRGGVVSLVWAAEFLRDEPPRDTCPGLKVQRADLREEPSSTHHPRGGEREEERSLWMDKVRHDPLLIWLRGQRRGRSGEGQHTAILRSFPQTQLALLCCESVSWSRNGFL